MLAVRIAQQVVQHVCSRDDAREDVHAPAARLNPRAVTGRLGHVGESLAVESAVMGEDHMPHGRRNISAAEHLIAGARMPLVLHGKLILGERLVRAGGFIADLQLADVVQHRPQPEVHHVAGAVLR